MTLKSIINKVGGSLAYNSRVAKIREPKEMGPVGFDADIDANIRAGLKSCSIEAEEFKVDLKAYAEYFEKAGYPSRHPKYYAWNIKEKSLEHYIAAELLDIKNGEVYIDIASERSPVPEIYGRLFGPTTFRQDLSYPEGLNGDRIGGDAARMPVPDGFADKMALHCSLEHFEGSSDIDFIKEVGRVLKKGGRCCIVPMYMHDRYAVQTDPSCSGDVLFEADAVVYCAKGWGNRHGRFYDPVHLKSRIIDNLGPLSFRLYRIVNATEVDESCYARFALLLEK